MTETTILNDSAVSEIEALPYITVGWGRRVELTVEQRDALCATVKHLRAESFRYKTGFDDYVRKLETDNERLTTGLVNLYHVITNQQCERKVALGMATSAVSSLQSQLEQLRAERDALRDSASIVAFQAHQIDGKIAESLIAQGETALRSRVLELCKSKAAECEREAENADMRLRTTERDVIENEARAIKELAVELEKL